VKFFDERGRLTQPSGQPIRVEHEYNEMMHDRSGSDQRILE
jgi:hypothetical protein